VVVNLNKRINEIIIQVFKFAKPSSLSSLFKFCEENMFVSKVYGQFHYIGASSAVAKTVKKFILIKTTLNQFYICQEQHPDLKLVNYNAITKLVFFTNWYSRFGIKFEEVLNIMIQYFATVNVDYTKILKPS
jgi:hypothetical protein